MQNQSKGQFDFKKIPVFIYIIIFFLGFSNPVFFAILIIIFLSIFKDKKNFLTLMDKLVVSPYTQNTQAIDKEPALITNTADLANTTNTSVDMERVISGFSTLFMIAGKEQKLKKGKKYLQIALNGNIYEAENVLRSLPNSEKIIIEAGTPLIKSYGIGAVRRIRNISPNAYIVADMKTADLSEREVSMCAQAGANALTCLGVAPLEVIEGFISACEKYKVEAMLDMMNVPSAIVVLRKLKKLPRVVILHRGVDETELSKEKQIPFYQIKQVKGVTNCLVAVAGGDTAREVESAVFNDADIVVVWKDFFVKGEGTRKIIDSFLKEIR
jgi:3-keto-L-gulonate-6-phosphate decarboxylase